MPRANERKRWLIEFWIFRIWITEQDPVIKPIRKAVQTAKPDSPSVNPQPTGKESHEKE